MDIRLQIRENTYNNITYFILIHCVLSKLKLSHLVNTYLYIFIPFVFNFDMDHKFTIFDSTRGNISMSLKLHENKYKI